MSHCSNDAEIKAVRNGSLIRYDIDARLTLAGQPQPEDFAQLAAEGFTLVINMRSDPERAAREAANAAAAGLHYLHLTVPAYELESEHLASFHQTLQQASGRVFLHCRSATRVALLWLLDQTVYAGVPREDAEAQLRAAGYTEDAMETFEFCADDYFERAAAAAGS